MSVNYMDIIFDRQLARAVAVTSASLMRLASLVVATLGTYIKCAEL
jgi:hypothetical protein